jgi:predicted RND superfamily exporter protein
MDQNKDKKDIFVKFIELTLKFRVLISSVLILITGFFLFQVFANLEVRTDFFELYPPKHPYIKLYKEFRKMFGSANVLTIILQKEGGEGEDVFNPVTIRKLHELTMGILQTKGVNPVQVSSLTHPRVKQVVINGYGIGVFPMTYPFSPYPSTQDACDTLRKNVYSQEGIRGFYVSLNDQSVALYGGFWEEGLDFRYLYNRMNELKASIEDANHKLYISGYPMLYAWLDHYRVQILIILSVTILVMIPLILKYFKSGYGLLITLVSGAISAIWGLGFCGTIGYSLDPLLLVVPVLLSARALSHSCQCLDRYNQENIALGDSYTAIIKSYSHLYPPAMLAIVTDGLGVLTISIATIPLMQKLAYISSFWIVSIFVAVMIINPILISFFPSFSLKHRSVVQKEGKVKGKRFESLYNRLVEFFHKASNPGYKWITAIILFTIVIGGGYFCSTHLKIGDSSAGAAILFSEHPYNIASNKVNKDFLGSSRLVVVIKGKKEGAIKDKNTLRMMDHLAYFMKNNIEGVGGTLSMNDLLIRVFRNYREGSPKWELIPQSTRDLGSLFWLIEANMAPGEQSQFVSPDYKDASVTAFIRNYTFGSIKTCISQLRGYAQKVDQDPDSKVEIKLAAGLLGIIAAVNEEVEWSYWAILVVIFATTFFLCVITYRSFTAALILIIPLYASQVVCELFMYFLHIDLNIDSLPVASIGVGVGIDYGIYLLSRLKEECGLGKTFQESKFTALMTTGKIIMFTALTLLIGVVFWLFSSLKFQAEMGFLIMVLMVFNMIGALVFIPCLCAIFKPNFIKRLT